MGALARNFDQTDYLRLVGNTYAILDLGRGFSAESRFGVYFSNWENNWFSPDYYIEPTDRLDVNQVGRSHNNRTNFNWNNLLHYTLQSDIHNLKVTAGYTMESFEHRTLNGSGNAVPGNAPEFRYIEAATTAFWAQGLNERNTQASYLSRVEYGYKYRYLITASFRADGSSRFSEENRWGFFPAVSAAWNIQEEAFLKDIRWLSQLKLRAGWGQVGNQNINNDALLTTLGRAIYVYGADEALDVGAAPATVGNPDLRWEAVEDLNFGLDFGLFNQSISFTVDYFERRSKDMLMQISIPAYLGAAFSTPWANVGRLETRGIELTAAYQKRVSTDLSFNIRLNASRARSTMRELAFGEEIWSGNHQRLDLLTRTAEGQPAGAFYGWVTNGIFQNQEDVINHTDEFGNRIQPLAQPGDFRFMDLNGDGRLDDNDRRTIGNPEPELTFGLNISMNYKAFDLFVLFNGVYGNDVLNALQPYTHAGNGVYNAYRGALFDAWSGEGTSNTQPRLAVRDDNQNFRYSDYFIQDGTFLRLRSAQIGYTIPPAVSQTVNINRARIFIGGENLFTWTNYSGLDPDIGGSALERGIDWGQYPLPQVFMAGVNITF
jgi:TonB-linked SusC/RagA family outer membrane protein